MALVPIQGNSYGDIYYGVAVLVTPRNLREFDILGWNPAPPNMPPVLTVLDRSMARNTSLAASYLFSVSDPDGDTMTDYHFWQPRTRPSM